VNSYNGWSGYERTKADVKLKALIAAGDLTLRMACVMCGQEQGCIQLHLEDYSRVETATPICVEDHMLLHTRFTHPNRWLRRCLTAMRGEVSTPWASAGHYFKAHPWRRDEPPLTMFEQPEFDAMPPTWWMELKLYPIDLKTGVTV
jgi:hypothetical protein